MNCGLLVYTEYVTSVYDPVRASSQVKLQINVKDRPIVGDKILLFVE